jgi:dynein heavy chain, axonemal
MTGTKDDIVLNFINFEVDNNLFKGFLLAQHQIEETSKNREKVAQVEKSFIVWMKQINTVIVQGGRITRENSDDGPLTELEHWRRMLSLFNYVVEFTDSRAFQSYLKCLKLSRSKLVGHWKKTEDDLLILMNEARDNVRFLKSIEKFWDPLYRCDPKEVIGYIPSLFQAVRSVYTSSGFFNSNIRMTSILSKIVNQLIIGSKTYLTNRDTLSIWAEDKEVLIEKIEDCKKLKTLMRESYQKLLCDMADSGENPFHCSDTFLFERLDLFEKRLNKVKEISQNLLRYQVLDQIKISGMEVFADRIKEAYKTISEKSYDPLVYRDEEFDKDFLNFNMETDAVEAGMSNFVKQYVENIETAEMRLLTLKRFAALDLDCLHLDHRFLDVAVILEKEIEDIKDKYNEERASPSIGRDVPPVVGRISWARSLLKKMEEPMASLKNRECVVTHKKAQLSVKYYNYLAGVIFHYEVMHHKAWFAYAENVRSQLEGPLIFKNPETNRYEVNLDRHVLQILRETEGMMKLGLEVPKFTSVMFLCRHQIEDTYNMTKALVERNNRFRLSIYPIFTPLMRVHLIKLERVFAPAISTVTWLSKNIEKYFQQIIDVIQPLESFIHEVSDFNDRIIEKAIKSIEERLLIILPKGAVTPEQLLQMNVEHRQKEEKKIAMKSLAAERAAIDLIKKFVDKSGVPDYDDSGKFQLPPDKITQQNVRVEEFKPIDKVSVV